jgi:hypothetical protein
MTTIETIQQEHNDLSLHVDLCAQRYEAVEKRLTSLESKVDQINIKIDSYKAEMTKIMVTTAGTVIVSIIGLAVTIINKGI